MAQSVLMVCLGNICRSPLAQGVFEARARQAGLDVFIDSAGTAGYHHGCPPDSRAIQVAMEWGIDISHQKARQLTLNDLEQFDQIYLMDHSNQRAVRQPGRVHGAGRVELVLSLVASSQGAYVDEVPDPYYGQLDDFRSVIEMLDQAALIWVRQQSAWAHLDKE